MKGLFFAGNGRYEVKETKMPELKSEEDVLIRVEAAAICGTDIHILEVPPGHPAAEGAILGHEFSGQIEKAGSKVADVKPGDRVVVDPSLFCGKCYYCRHGQPNMCMHNTCLGVFLDGGFAQYCVAPQSCLYKVSPDTPAETAVHLDPAGCVLTSLGKLNPQVGENALILGAGPVGLYFIMMLKRMGMGKIIVSEPSSYRRQYAYKFGADLAIDPSSEPLEQILKEHTVDGADFSVDTVGTLINDAVSYTRKGGRILLFGMNSNAWQTICQNTITRKDLTIMGNYASRFKFDDTLRILEKGLLPVEDMVTHRVSLEEFQSGIDALKSGRAIKVLVDPWK
ncbi:alcohol dehydrogenase [Lachnospiraceae bacterium]|uniref:alcohol dehydrogenase catalytic domain-containing protein n=1 Tax=Extibacter sp. GGCC_0201 TaxID=2731209 RepID=UPI001AA0EF8C|nr:alcohol dehydrogenase catalytic domain-containing protein [Extibacter sp. GGCC_0201]MBO1720407.1 alcohol dehydrogenase catalytic domain-containing protein [Extibacter sp. GGCC_0201]BDF34509.1 alcohol dehydrogenase [Lachnospiraceae bacterium]BDF38511.1 alcohol dehydrogenase [Lachnospiraceae bacterium]